MTQNGAGLHLHFSMIRVFLPRFSFPVWLPYDGALRHRLTRLRAFLCIDFARPNFVRSS